MAMCVFIQPHERGEAIEAYKDWLTPEQIDEIDEAPETALVKITRDFNHPGTKITIIEEG